MRYQPVRHNNLTSFVGLSLGCMQRAQLARNVVCSVLDLFYKKPSPLRNYFLQRCLFGGRRKTFYSTDMPVFDHEQRDMHFIRVL